MKLRILIQLLLVACLGVNGASAQVTLTTSKKVTTTHTTLTLALAAADSGSKITMSAGVYNESVTIPFDITLTPDPGVSITGLTLANACNVTLDSTITVTTVLSLGNGKIIIPNQTEKIILTLGATVSRASGYVFGKMQKSVAVAGYVSVRFEIGDDGYTPVDLGVYAVTTSGAFTVSTKNGITGSTLALGCVNAAQNVNRMFTIQNSGTVFANYSSKFTFLSTDVDEGADYRMFRVASYNIVEDWLQPTVQIRYPNDITVAAITADTTDFYIGEQVVPIHLSPASDAHGVLPDVILDWDSPVGATSYLYEIYLNLSKTPLKAGRVTPSEFAVYPLLQLGYDTTYYWHVKAADNNITSDWSPIDSFTVGRPDSVIDNDIVHMHFIHGEGRIDSLRYKKGSNRDLLYQSLNTAMKGGLNRVNNETGTKCYSWVIDNASATLGSADFYYAGSYGSKHVNMKWGTAIGFEMTVAYNFPGATKFTPGVYWRPGGDVGPQYDYLTFVDSTGKKVTRYSGYPYKDSILFNGYAMGSGITDTRFDETFGFKNIPIYDSLVGVGTLRRPYTSYALLSTDSLYAVSGAALNGPYSRGTFRGSVIREFAIKSNTEYWTWMNLPKEPFFDISPGSTGKAWCAEQLETISWQSNFKDSLITIKLSTDGGRTFPITLDSNLVNSGSYVVTVPSTLSSTNCRIRFELSNHPEINGMNTNNFSIQPLDAVIFYTEKSEVTTAPGESFVVPYFINPNTKTPKLIYAFEMRVTFNRTSFSLANWHQGLNIPPGWMINVSDSSARGFIQIGGLCRKDSLDYPISTGDTAIVLTFTAKSTARVGTVDTLKIENLYLEAADAYGKPYIVNGNDCLVNFHSALSGRISYYSSKTALTNGSINLKYSGHGNKSILPIDSVFVVDSIGGRFDFSPIPPGASVMLSIAPSFDEGNKAIDTVITSGDAFLAFLGRDGGPQMLTGYQKIAADVNGDGHVSSIDAYAILQRSTRALTSFKDLDVTNTRGNWIFVDSAFKMTSYNWLEAPKYIAYTQLDTARLKENFFGILLGDVLATFAAKSMVLSKDNSIDEVNSTEGAFASGPVQFSVPKLMNASVGDTVSIPIVLNANKNLLGSFHATMRFNTAVLKYAGKFVRSSKLVGFAGWDMDVAGNNTQGTVSIGAADFEQKMNPVTGSGEAVWLKFVVQGSNKWGDSTDLVFTNVGATDTLAKIISAAGINGKIITSGMTGVPASFMLMQNYPNPFNPTTNIRFGLPEQALTTVTIYNILGQTVRTLAATQFAAGYHEVIWNAINDNNIGVASGAYFYRMSAVGAGGVKYSEVKRMMLLK